MDDYFPLNILFHSSAILSTIGALILAGCASYPQSGNQTPGVFGEIPDDLGIDDSVESTIGAFIPDRIVTDEGLDLIRTYEGSVMCSRDRSKHCPYNDASQFCTIGYGHLIGRKECKEIVNLLIQQNIRSGITEDHAKTLLRSDLTLAQQGLEAQMINAKIGKTSVTDFQYDSLVSFIFNVGRGNFSRSTLLEELKKRTAIDGNSLIAYEFSRWVKSNGVVLPGLQSRRAREIEHFFSQLGDGSEATTIVAPAAEVSNTIDIRLGEH